MKLSNSKGALHFATPCRWRMLGSDGAETAVAEPHIAEQSRSRGPGVTSGGLQGGPRRIGLARALLLKHLKERGLKGVRLIISDACIGLAKGAPGSAVAAYLRVRRRSSIFQ